MSEFDPKKELENWDKHCEKTGLEYGNEGQATPAKELEERLLDPNVAKSELEHYAARLVTTLKAELQKREWISVEERLPEKSGIYPAVGIAKERNPLIDWQDALCMFDADAEPNQCKWNHSSGFYDNGITHWMPLPLPPTGSTNDRTRT